MKNISSFIYIGAIVFFFGMIVGSAPEKACAQVDPGDLCGFAWGATNEAATPQGLGWVSFNSKDCDTDGSGSISSSEAAANPGCPAGSTATYKVSIDSSRNLVGHAWSSNFGWLQFGNLGTSDMPSTSGNSAGQANVNSNTGGNNNVSGWARFCAGTINGACTGTSRTDGWDGWLSLRGTGGASYGVTLNGTTGKFAGYSWGGPTVGWLRWDRDNDDGRTVRYCSPSIVTAGLSANPSSGAATLNTTLDAYTNTPGSGGSTTYQFKCSNSDLTYSSAQTTDTYSCSYSTPGTYTAWVKVNANSQSPEASTQITVTSGGGPGPGGDGDLSVTCDVVPSSTVIGGYAAVNNPVVWHASVVPSGAAIPPYNYLFEFDDNNDSDSTFECPAGLDCTQSTSATHFDYTRTYRQLGKKSVKVTVTDSTVPTPATGSCAPATVRVVVDPTIIEI